MAGAGIVQPEPAPVQPGRVRHRQPRGDHAAFRDLQHDAATLAPVAPAVNHVARTDRGGIARATVRQGQAVEVAAILRGQLAQERRPPERSEAGPLRKCGDASEACGDEHRAAGVVDGHVVDIEVAGGVGHLRHIEPIVSLVEFARPEQVLETPELVERAQPEGLAIGPKAHRAVERALENGEPAFGVTPQEEEFARLVGGERQADLLLSQPG